MQIGWMAGSWLGLDGLLGDAQSPFNFSGDSPLPKFILQFAAFNLTFSIFRTRQQAATQRVGCAGTTFAPSHSFHRINLVESEPDA
jgi:hypothetical protein